MPMHKELTRAIRLCRERDVEQGFWEIRYYAARNDLMHCGILDHRICGEYDKVRYNFWAPMSFPRRIKSSGTRLNIFRCLGMLYRLNS